MIEVIKNILPYKINNKIILLLVKSTNWFIGKDYGNDEQLLIDLLETGGNSHGMSLETLNGPKNIYTNNPLNNYAEIIYEIVKNHTKYKFLKPVRFYWNYYNQSSCAIPHFDSDENYFVSFIYNLNTNNGGTNINGEFFKSVAGEAIVFKSNILHNSVAQSDVKGRFNLNCIIELERNI